MKVVFGFKQAYEIISYEEIGSVDEVDKPHLEFEILFNVNDINPYLLLDELAILSQSDNIKTFTIFFDNGDSKKVYLYKFTKIFIYEDENTYKCGFHYTIK